MCGVKVTVVVGSIGAAIYLQAIFHGNGPWLIVLLKEKMCTRVPAGLVGGDSSLSSC